MPKVECRKCGTKLSAPAEYQGRTVKCKACGNSFVLRFTGRNKSTVAKYADTSESPDNKSTIAFRLTEGSTPSESSLSQPAQ